MLLTQVWLQVDGLHLDWVPAEGPLQPLALSPERPAWVGAAAGWRWLKPERLPDAIAADDVHLQSTSREINLDQRVHPFRNVEDHWRGIEVLTCGHFIATNPLMRAQKRRCLCCETTLPARMFRAVSNSREAMDWFALLSDEERGDAITALFTAGLPGR